MSSNKIYPVDPDTGLEYEPEPRERGQASKVDLATLKLMLMRAHSTKQIAKLLGVSTRTVQRQIAKHNLK